MMDMIVWVEIVLLDKKYCCLSSKKVSEVFGGVADRLEWSRCSCLNARWSYRHVVFVCLGGIAAWKSPGMGKYVVEGFRKDRSLSIGSVNSVVGVDVVELEEMGREMLEMERSGFERCW